ncbi:MAG: Roadblock/LC7 family protein [Cyanobacteria bacterium RYN_339]|jgi:predicted regulator of Ras-like GTPase activity (Roadblock/LC7/MglB family)|nr:Roadblock/LC7 family protein [Cyanobacteria bacterium RYN_339]
MLNKILTNAVVTEEGVSRIHQMLGELVKDVDATAAFLVEKSGQMLATEGEIRGLDTTAIASLVSSSFASTRAVAKLIGEQEFQAMFQQGDRSSIFLYSLPTQDILVVIFSDLSKTGLVKVQAEQTAKALAEELIQMMHPGH